MGFGPSTRIAQICEVPTLQARPQTDAGSVFKPLPASLGVLCRHFEPLPSPDAFDPLVVHIPALDTEQRRDPAIALAPIRAGQPHDGLDQRRLIVRVDTPIALRRAQLADDPTLGYRIPHAYLLNTAPATLGV